MNENINLCDILKGHEGETFYSPIFGDLTFIVSIYPCVRFKTTAGDIWDINLNGKIYNNSDELCVFPSKDQMDWNKWVKEQNPKVPKTWSELIKNNKYKDCEAGIDKNGVEFAVTPIEKSALAILKIHQIIEVGYGGNATQGWCITVKDNKFAVYKTDYKFCPFAFHTKEQAEEFFSKTENIELLKDYFMYEEI